MRPRAFALTAAGVLSACGNGDDYSVPYVPPVDASVSIMTADVAAAAVIPTALRFANWSPDAPAADICLSVHGAGAFEGPVLRNAFGGAGAAFAGIPPFRASAYVSVAPGSYDVRFVDATAPDCSQSIGADVTGGTTLASNAFATVAILGQMNGSDPATALRALSLADDNSVPSTLAAVRFVNALPSATLADGGIVDAPFVDIGTGSAVGSDAVVSTSTFGPIFLGVPFAGVSDAIETQGPTLPPTAKVDSNGYGLLAPLATVILSAHQSGGVVDLAYRVVDIAAGGAVTAVLLPSTCDSGGSGDAGCEYGAAWVFYVDNAATLGFFGPTF